MKQLLIILSLSCHILYSQNNSACSVSGKVLEKATLEAIPFANVMLYQDSTIITATATSDLDGNFSFKNLKPGIYCVSASYVGYSKASVFPIKVENGKNEKVKLLLNNGEGIKLCDIVVYTPPLINKSSPGVLYLNETCTRDGIIMRGGRSRLRKNNNASSEEYKHLPENDFRDVQHEPFSTLSIDVDRASYSNIRRYLNNGELPPADAVRVEEMINYFDYHYPEPQNEHPFSINTEYSECPWNANHSLVRIGIQGKKIISENAKPSNLVFLIDVSGSMETEDKLPLVKEGLRLLVKELRTQDRVAMVVYAGNAGLVLHSTSGADKKTIINAINNLEAGGSTAGEQGIELAYKIASENFISDGNNRVILATDGDFNVGVNTEEELVKLIEEKRKSNVFLTVLGFGTGNYKDSKMEQLADKGNGNYAYIDNLAEAKKILVHELTGTIQTIAKDVKIQLEFNAEKVKAYRLIGYENRILNKEDFNSDIKDAGELGAGHAVTAIYEIISVQNPDTSLISKRKPNTIKQERNNNNLLATVHIRYKQPSDKRSVLCEEIISDKKTAFYNCTENMKFSCAVASFGMLLRNSAHKGNSDYAKIIKMAEESEANDKEGYKSEFIHLVKTASSLSKGVDSEHDR